MHPPFPPSINQQNYSQGPPGQQQQPYGMPSGGGSPAPPPVPGMPMKPQPNQQQGQFQPQNGYAAGPPQPVQQVQNGYVPQQQPPQHSQPPQFIPAAPSSAGQSQQHPNPPNMNQMTSTMSQMTVGPPTPQQIHPPASGSQHPPVPGAMSTRPFQNGPPAPGGQYQSPTGPPQMAQQHPTPPHAVPSNQPAVGHPSQPPNINTGPVQPQHPTGPAPGPPMFQQQAQPYHQHQPGPPGMQPVSGAAMMTSSSQNQAQSPMMMHRPPGPPSGLPAAAGQQAPPLRPMMPPQMGPPGGHMPPGPPGGHMPRGPAGGHMPPGPAGGQMPPGPAGGHMPPGPPSFPQMSGQQPNQHQQFQSPGGPGMPPPPPGPPMPGQHQQMGGPPPLPGQQSLRPPGPGAYPQMQQQYPPQLPGGYAPGMPQMPGGGGQMQGAPRKLDPNAMPSAIQVMDDDSDSRAGVFLTGFPRAELPPLVTTDFVTDDQGICGPRYLRASLYNFPANQDMVKQSGIPIVIATTPLAEPDPREHPLPIVDFGPVGPVRCHRCKAYMCSLMEFIDGGRRFKCPFCKANSDVPEQYFSHLDHTGRRVDLPERPELFKGSFEVFATKEYCKNNLVPKEPAFIFMLDVSYNAVKSGLVNLFCQNIKPFLANLPRDYGQQASNMKIAFVTYDQTLHFYNLKSGVGQPQMMVVNDVDDSFVPLVEGFYVTLDEAEAAIDSLLTQIPQMFAETKVTEVVLGPVAKAGMEALKAADRGGKLFIFHSSLPTFEAPGKLKNREDRKLLGTEKEKTILVPQNEFYEKLAVECVQVGCCVDCFLFPNSYMDIATIGTLCGTTGGQVYKYPYFQADIDGEIFLNDLARDISRPIVFDAIMRIRTSTGIRPVDFYGAMYMSNTTDIELAALDCDKCVTSELKHDDKLDENEGAFVQVALLFTSCGGQRRLRIHNFAIAVSTDLAQLYRNADLDTMMNFFFKQAGRLTLQKGIREVRENLVNRCAHILACYRSKCAQPSSAGQLILPEGMKLLPLFANCVIKSDALSGGSDVGCDERAWMMQLIPAMRPIDSLTYIYPKLLPILKNADAGDVDDLPRPVRCSYEYMEHAQAYLYYNGMAAFLWIGSQVSTQWLSEAFGVQSFQHINSDKHYVPELDTPASKSLRKIIDAVQTSSARRMKLLIIKQQDKLEPWFKHFLVEDAGATQNGVPAPSYVDFLCHIHKEIRSILA